MAAWSTTFARIRPFSGTHPSLLVVLVLMWEAVACIQPCRSGPYYFEIVVLTVTVCIALWASHIAHVSDRNPTDWGKVVGRALYDLFALGVVVMLTGIPWLVSLPTYSCDDARHRASEVLLSAAVLKDLVASRAIAQGTIAGSGAGLTFPPSGRTKSRMVTDNGIIIAAGDDPAVVFILTPSLTASEVKWKCVGYPAMVVPPFCRNE